MTEQEAVERIKMHMDWNLSKPTQEALDMAIKALEKQIPKKFARKEEFMAKNRCPECNAVLLFATLQLHCGKCGQAIDWSEEE